MCNSISLGICQLFDNPIMLVSAKHVVLAEILFKCSSVLVCCVSCFGFKIFLFLGSSRIGEFRQSIELMGGFGCIPFRLPFRPMLGRPKPSRLRLPVNCGYPRYLPDSEETRSYGTKLHSAIAENSNPLKEVTEDLERAGLVSSKLIVGIDFTKFNDWAGEKSFNQRSLHHIGDTPNPYQKAISFIGKTLAPLKQDNLIPCFGFGDVTTHDDDVFNLCPDGRECNGFEEVLTAYKEIVPSIGLAGPTSFAPIIEKAMSIVEKSGGQFHVLLIITSGQLNFKKQTTVDAIVAASKFPLSIILVGVGDGPWDVVKKLGDSTPGRAFDNLHFANFTDIMTKNVPPLQKEAEFAQEALMKVPSHYKETRSLSMAGSNFSKRVPLCRPHYRESSSVTTAPAAVRSTNENEVCAICSSNSVNRVLYCGHQICSECKTNIYHCPWCRIPVGSEDYKLI